MNTSKSYLIKFINLKLPDYTLAETEKLKDIFKLFLEYITATDRVVPSGGAKVTGIDSGVLGQISTDDDYIYICVIEGDPTTAIWKKSLLLATN